MRYTVSGHWLHEWVSVLVGAGATDAAGNNLVSAYSWEFTTEAGEEITTNGGGPGEYWWIVLVIIVVTMVALYLFWKNREEEEPETEENEIETQE